MGDRPWDSPLLFMINDLWPVHKQWASPVNRATLPRRNLSCIEINTEKATYIHILSGLARLTEISPDTAKILASQDINFPRETPQVS